MPLQSLNGLHLCIQTRTTAGMYARMWYKEKWVNGHRVTPPFYSCLSCFSGCMASRLPYLYTCTWRNIDTLPAEDSCMVHSFIAQFTSKDSAWYIVTLPHLPTEDSAWYRFSLPHLPAEDSCMVHSYIAPFTSRGLCMVQSFIAPFTSRGLLHGT